MKRYEAVIRLTLDIDEDWGQTPEEMAGFIAEAAVQAYCIGDEDKAKQAVVESIEEV